MTEEKSEEKINDLLVQWELAREEGHQLTAVDLCADEPELVGPLSKRMELLRASSWMLQDPVSASCSDSVSTSTDDTACGDREPTVEQFVDSLRSSNILEEFSWTTIDALAASWDSGDGRGFAGGLVDQQTLTPYQARVLLRGSDSPLRLDRYVILESIGSGGMGLVFKALHRSMQRIVAIKILPPHAVDSPEKVQRFQREIKAVAKLSHPGVVTAFDAHQSGGTHFLVMEYVDGQNLQEVIETSGAISTEDAICIIDQVAAGLQAAHAIGMVHRDIKPTNIMLTDDGMAKLLDLGLARSMRTTMQGGDPELTQDGLAMGTASYMSPEQALDARKADERSDIYSLGCTLHYLLVGRPPFVKKTTVQTIVAHREEDAPPLPSTENGALQSLQSVYAKMVQKRPAERYQTIAELRNDLRVLTIGTHNPPPVAPSKFDSQEKQVADSFGERWGLLGGFGLALILLAAILFYAFGGKDPSISHRDFSKWAIAMDGIVTIQTEHGEQMIAYADELPDGKFRVVGLDVGSVSEDQTIDPVFSVDGLESLVLTGFEDVQVSRIAAMESLRDLSLYACDVGDQEIRAIAKMTNLTDLSITDCPLSDEGLRWLATLNALEYLDVSGTDITGDGIAHLQSLNRLQELVLSNTYVTDDDLVKLPRSLQHLDLAWCDVSDASIARLSEFPKLRSLDLEDTEVTEQGIRNLCRFGHLRILNLSGIPLTSKTIADLTQIRGLKNLQLSHLDLTDDVILAIASLDGITDLNLSETNLNDESLMKLATMKDVELIDVSNTKVTQTGINRFNRKTPEIMLYTDDMM